MRVASFLTLIIYFLYSCRYLPCGWDIGLSSPPSKVQSNALIGIYKPDNISLEAYPDLQSVNATIELEHGWLKFKNVPLGVFDFEHVYNGSKRLVDGVAKWGIDQKSSESFSVNINYNDEDLKDFGTSFRLYQKDDKYVIFVIVGDPDECRAVRFVQQ